MTQTLTRAGTRAATRAARNIAAFGLVTVIAACGGGPVGVHAIGVSQSCGADASPFLAGGNGVPVRCTSQRQSPWGG